MPYSRHDLLTACTDRDIHKVMVLKAAQNNHAAILQLCIDEGVTLSHLDLEDETESHEILKVLITKGLLDTNKDLETGGGMLVNAVWELKVALDLPNAPWISADRPTLRYDFTAWLLEHGAEQGRTDFSQLLVEHGATVSGSGALAAAPGNKHFAMVQSLLDQGADVDEIGVHDYGDRRKLIPEGTALRKAAANGDVETAKLLIARCAKLQVKDPLQRTPLIRALEEKQEEAAAHLRSVYSTE